MNKISIILTVCVLVIVVVIAVVFLKTDEPQSLGYGQEVNSYAHITSTNASSTVGKLVRGGAGVLSSITINTTHATVIGIYDGNTTSTSTTVATKIGSIKASAAEQTLIYDVALVKGLVLEVPAGYAGDLTVSYR